MTSTAGGTEGGAGSAAPPGPRWGPPVFVWGVWALALLGALAFAWKYGSSVPRVDDWELVPYVTGERPATLGWMWELQNSHRNATYRSVMVGVGRLAGGDVSRAGPFFNVLVLGGLAAALVRAAARVRGRAEYTDAFFPLVLLHWGGQKFLAANSFSYLTAPVLVCVVLIVLVRSGGRLTLRAGLLAGACLVLLPLSSAVGLAYLPALAVWLVYAAVVRRRSGDPHGRRDGLVALALASAALLLIPVYFVGYASAPDFMRDYYGQAGPSGVLPTLKGAVAVFAASLGPLGAAWWPVSGLVLLALTVPGAALLAGAARRGRGPARVLALGMLLFFAAAATVALAVGWGRPGSGLSYDLLVFPALCAVYFTWMIVRPEGVGRLTRVCLFGLACFAAAYGCKDGLKVGWSLRAPRAALEADLRNGMPAHELVARHKMGVMNAWGTHDEMADYMGMLHRSGVGPFRHLRPDPAFREVPLTVAPSVEGGARLEGTTVHGAGPESCLTFTLPEPRFVSGVRVTGWHSAPENARLWVTYRRPGERDPPADRRQSLFSWQPHPLGGPLDGEARPFTVNISDTVDQIRICPDEKPFRFRIKDVTLLVPETEK